MTRAPFATAQRIAFASASTGIDRCGPTTFAISSSAGGARPAIPTPSFVWAAIRPATNVPWPCVSTVAGPATKLFAAAIRPLQLGMRAVDARVDHGHPHGGERRRLGPGVERRGSASRTTGAKERVVRDERRAASSEHARRSAPPTCRAAPRRRRRDRESARIGREVDDLGSRRASRSAARPPRDRRPARGRRRTGPRSAPGPRRGRAQRPRRAAAALADHFACPAGTVIVSAGPAWPSAVSR